MIQLLVKGKSLLPHCACAKYGALYYSREKEKDWKHLTMRDNLAQLGNS